MEIRLCQIRRIDQHNLKLWFKLIYPSQQIFNWKLKSTIFIVKNEAFGNYYFKLGFKGWRLSLSIGGWNFEVKAVRNNLGGKI